MTYKELKAHIVAQVDKLTREGAFGWAKDASEVLINVARAEALENETSLLGLDLPTKAAEAMGYKAEPGFSFGRALRNAYTSEKLEQDVTTLKSALGEWQDVMEERVAGLENKNKLGTNIRDIWEAVRKEEPPLTPAEIRALRRIIAEDKESQGG